ncbi:MAG: sugar-binding domain-containing protein [Chitinophagaceae bacterium]
MKKGIYFFILLQLFYHTSFSQSVSMNLFDNWQFSQEGENNWHDTQIPGSIYTDLFYNKLIPDPYFRDNEKKVQWVDSVNWQYKRTFSIDSTYLSLEHIELLFEGLDTYASVYVNNHLVLEADNMFRPWSVDIKPYIQSKNNILSIHFKSALANVDSLAKQNRLVLPDNNRVYVRKAQFQFGWDWGPKLIGAGIWKKISIEAWSGNKKAEAPSTIAPMAKLIQQHDSIGQSFYFEINGKPVFAKGANWIPGDAFLRHTTKSYYSKILRLAKKANMNMLRVWGGGIYEADEFYDICDELGIMVWQDFMFAGGMYPGDAHFMENVKAEVKHQVERLRKHPCVVLWCGNNEIDEAWHNWGWQNQFNLHGADSVEIWNNYKKLFEDSIRTWVNEFDGQRPYVASSPTYGWGRKESMQMGDSHYWGVWWGLEDWEVFENKTGRFVSEYGMQSMPNWNTIKSYTNSSDRHQNSKVIEAHQKAGNGFEKINHYLTRYFTDSATLKKISLEDYSYLSQCMQYYIFKNSIAIHRSKSPTTMGSLLWQLNDCWPVTSWSIIDYSITPKASWYAIKEAYRDDQLPIKDSIIPKAIQLEKSTIKYKIKGNELILTSTIDAHYVELSILGNTALFSENYFTLYKNKSKHIHIEPLSKEKSSLNKLKIKSLADVLQ